MRHKFRLDSLILDTCSGSGIIRAFEIWNVSVEISSPPGLSENRRECKAADQRGEVHSTSPFWAGAPAGIHWIVRAPGSPVSASARPSKR